MATYTGTQDLAASGEVRENELAPGGKGVWGMDEDRVARGLGWFSIGLGLAELLAPRTVARICGTRNHSTIFRLYGLREIAAGIGILASSRPKSAWLWSRVAGDAVDLASLGSVAASEDNDRGRAIFAIANVAAVTALDVCCAQALSAREGSPIWARAEASMIVDRSPEECYAFWRNFDNLPTFMSYVEAVETRGGGVSHWIACAPAGAAEIEWDAEIESDLPNRRISWRTLEGSDVRHSGSVDFEPAPGGRGTIVRAQMDYGHAFRMLAPLASLIGQDPEQMMRKELRRFKQVMETGEVITTEGQPAGRAESITKLDRMGR